MPETYWATAAGEIITDSSGRPCNCPHDPCSAVCVGDMNFGYQVRTSFNWNGTVITPADMTVLWDNGSDVYHGINTADTWSQTDVCDGQGFLFRIYCRDDQWYFNLIVDGVDYANPAVYDTAGGAVLLSASPLHLFGEITDGYFADVFPFCGKSGGAPSGDFLYDFHFNLTES